VYRVSLLGTVVELQYKPLKLAEQNLKPSMKNNKTRRTKNPIVIWEKPHRYPSRQRITTLQSPHWLQWDAPHLPPKLSLPLRRSPPHLLHPCLNRPHSPSHIDDTQIQSAVLPQYTFRTDRWDRRQTCKNTRLWSIDCIATRLL